MKKLLCFCLLAAAVGLSGCTSHKFHSGEMMNVSDVRFETTRFKKGRACENTLFPIRAPFVDGWFGIPLGGEARVLQAIKNGHLNKLEFMEETSEYYFILGKTCIDAYGE